MVEHVSHLPAGPPPFVYHSAVTLADCLFPVKLRITLYSLWLNPATLNATRSQLYTHARWCRPLSCKSGQSPDLRKSALPTARQSRSRESVGDGCSPSGTRTHRLGLRLFIIQSESIEHLGLNYSSTSTYFQGANFEAWMSSGVRVRAASGRVVAKGAIPCPSRTPAL